ncbi:hypothetical protein AWJ20_2563 [Sugiyamaella lignohabitans]|uniref:Inhibitor I9 domain-containing protein n=1 Tax=Sugiyamaella lignohabitans TaxID=796027 RepID=A0A161HWV8_9ASCO|nr:uncharacterized protein AWJ20_2563 [Sugiyamaella lignohabitans]ANB14946.1 hypothetical protein AWJ20_2563 [Sugiyamaella lignohabitans]
MKVSTTLAFVATLATMALSAQSAALAGTTTLQKAASDSSLMKYIIIFEKGLETPDRVVKAAEKKLKEIGAYITYEYNTVVKGFAVSAPADVIAIFEKNDNDAQYPFIVEVDQVVSANNH